MIKIYDKKLYAVNYGHIYIVECIVNGKVYVGQTKQKVSRRWSQHLTDSHSSNNPFQRALRKYGKNKFVIHVAPIIIKNAEELNNEEIRIISVFQSTQRKYGYNIHHGGGSVGKIAKETLVKLRRVNSRPDIKNRVKNKNSQKSERLKYVDDFGNTLIFESRNDAIRYLKISNYVAIKMIKNGRLIPTKSKPNFCFIIEKYWGIQCVNDSKIYSSVREVAKKYHVGRTNLRRVLDGIIESTKGLKFRYVY